MLKISEKNGTFLKNSAMLLNMAAFLLTVSVSLFLSGCGNSVEDKISASQGRNVPLVVSTIFPGYDFSREVGGDKVEAYKLLKPGAESHTYEPTPQDMVLINKCDIFIYAGGESDTWIDEILADNTNPDRIVISMMDCVSAVTEEESEGMHEGGLLAELMEEEEEEEYDEHVWTSLSNAALISEEICKALCEKSPENASLYQENLDNYRAELLNLDKQYLQMIEGAKRKVIVVGDRFPFRYLCDDYNLEYYAAFPGCAENAEVTADTLITLCDKVNEENIPVVFSIEFSAGKIADSICECTNARRMTLHSAHNVSSDEEKAGTTYLSIMENNLLSLKEALY